jgi:hypothetical protein
MEAALVRTLVHRAMPGLSASRDLSVPVLRAIGRAAEDLRAGGGPLDAEAVLRASQSSLAIGECIDAWLHYELGVPRADDCEHAVIARRVAGYRRLRAGFVEAIRCVERMDLEGAFRIVDFAAKGMAEALRMRATQRWEAAE